jgi:C4-dicarboxylate transporter DctM subunit
MAISAVIMAIVAVSNGFGFLIAQEQMAPKLAAWLATHFDSRWSMLLALNLGFFALAAVMDEIAIMVILGPMLISIANQFGVDPIHFGAMIVTNVAIGMAMPPIGYCLFVGMAVGGVGLGTLSRAIAPFVAMMVVVLMVVTFWPAVALALLR